jgi:hypothetical protein
MVIGGIIVDRSDRSILDGKFASFRSAEKMYATLKWEKVTNQKYEQYRKFVDIFFDNNPLMHFKSIIIDTTKLDMRRFKKSKDDAYYTYMYLLLLHCFGPYLKDEDKALIYLHRRATKYKLSTLYSILNNGIRKKYRYKNEIVRHIYPLEMKDQNILQSADVLMGGIGYRLNGLHQKAGTRRAKINLSEYIRLKANVASWFKNTPRSNQYFSLWHFKLK